MKRVIAILCTVLVGCQSETDDPQPQLQDAAATDTISKWIVERWMRGQMQELSLKSIRALPSNWKDSTVTKTDCLTRQRQSSEPIPKTPIAMAMAFKTATSSRRDQTR